MATQVTKGLFCMEQQSEGHKSTRIHQARDKKGEKLNLHGSVVQLSSKIATSQQFSDEASEE